MRRYFAFNPSVSVSILPDARHGEFLEGRHCGGVLRIVRAAQAWGWRRAGVAPPIVSKVRARVTQFRRHGGNWVTWPLRAAATTLASLAERAMQKLPTPPSPADAVDAALGGPIEAGARLAEAALDALGEGLVDALPPPLRDSLVGQARAAPRRAPPRSSLPTHVAPTPHLRPRTSDPASPAAPQYAYETLETVSDAAKPSWRVLGSLEERRARLVVPTAQETGVVRPVLGEYGYVAAEGAAADQAHTDHASAARHMRHGRRDPNGLGQQLAGV